MKGYTSWPVRAVRQNSCLQTEDCAVLVPLLYDRETTEEQVLLEVRSAGLRWQPKEICFPGGHIEAADSSPWAAAMRETAEELGIDAAGIHYIGALDYVESPIGVRVYPFAARLDTRRWRPARAEVDHVFTIPLSFLQKQTPEIAYFQLQGRPLSPSLITMGVPENWRPRTTYEVKIFTYKNYKIWGITAQILDNFLGIRAIIQT